MTVCGFQVLIILFLLVLFNENSKQKLLFLKQIALKYKFKLF
jgi:hypothetical protein